MEFTFNEYRNILETLKQHNYIFSSYYNWSEHKRSVILRHDVDVSLEKALAMAEFEHAYGVTSTYYVLITADFYNAFNRRNRTLIQKIRELGMEIGLHFDESLYSADCNIVEAIRGEIFHMEQMLSLDVKSVSMHIPTPKTMQADYDLGKSSGGGQIINSYSSVFFNQFKYVSDSKRNWRENIYQVIESGLYPRIQLLTHPIWYNADNMPMWEVVSNVLCSQAKQSYQDFEVHTCNVEGRKTVAECLEGLDDSGR